MGADMKIYQERIDALFKIVPSFQRVGRAGYNPGIGTMSAFDDFLGNPHRRFKVIHVAGTNGKGSVSSMLASVLMGLGYRVGLYTSPHLVDFRERIKVDGEMIAREAVIDFLDRSEEFVAEYEPSFFEITTAMAFDYFAACGVDYAVVECGLGGRLDSTNIVTPVLSVITSIGLDHTDILGDTLEKVAYEKGGIIKGGVPVVVGEVTESVEGVLRGIASERGADMYRVAEYHKAVESQNGHENGIFCAQAVAEPQNWHENGSFCAQNAVGDPYQMLAGKINPSHNFGAGPSHSRCHGRHVFPLPTSEVEDILLKMDLKGDYQRGNLMTVLCSLEILLPSLHILTSMSSLSLTEKLPLSLSDTITDSICRAAERTGFRGRWEVLGQRPYIVCDIAHNPHGMRPVMEQLKRVYREAIASADGGEKPRLYMIFGVMADKDLATISEYLPREAYYYFTQADSPRAMDANLLCDRLSSEGFVGEVKKSIGEAVKKCLSQTGENDIVYIGGSSYVVAEALKFFLNF